MLNIYDNYAEIGDGAEIGAGAYIGNFAEIGDYVEIGASVNFGNYVEIGAGVKIGDFAEIGDYVEIGENANFGIYANIGNYSKIGDGANFGNYTKIGAHARIGDGVNLGDGVQIGDGVQVGDKFRCEGLNVIDFCTMSNIDGTGRKIHIYVHAEGITIRAGCFKGTLDEFCMKAEYEGKTLYARTVRAAAEVFADEIRQQGKKGGWDNNTTKEQTCELY